MYVVKAFMLVLLFVSISQVAGAQACDPLLCGDQGCAGIFDTADPGGCKVDFRIDASIPYIPQQSCYDTDDFNPSERGRLSYYLQETTISKTDYCVDLSQGQARVSNCIGGDCAVTEHLCTDQGIQSTIVSCPSGCITGSCSERLNQPQLIGCERCFESSCTQQACESLGNCVFVDNQDYVQCLEVQCVDQDNGEDERIQATVSIQDTQGISYATETDTCSSNETLTEYLCRSGQIDSRELRCPYGCENGVCKEKPEIICPTDYNPVCATDCSTCPQKTYHNSCEASKAQATILHLGLCYGDLVGVFAELLEQQAAEELSAIAPLQEYQYKNAYIRLIDDNISGIDYSQSPPVDFAQRVIDLYAFDISTEPSREDAVEFLLRPDIITYIILEMQNAFVSQVGQPFEGFTPQMYMSIYPGLKESDFDGATAIEGSYEVGCAQKTYNNECEARQAAATIEQQGECAVQHPPAVCTQEVKICPGTGAVLTRIGSSCSFPDCASASCAQEYDPVCGRDCNNKQGLQFSPDSSGFALSSASSLDRQGTKQMVLEAAQRLQVDLLDENDAQYFLSLLAQAPSCQLEQIYWNKQTDATYVTIASSNCEGAVLSIEEVDLFTTQPISSQNVLLTGSPVSVVFPHPPVTDLDGVDEYRATISVDDQTLVSDLLSLSATSCFDGTTQDTDNDDILDCFDLDDDNDNVLDGQDNCPLIPNSNQHDLDGNGVGDLCDDHDQDGVADRYDACAESSSTDYINAMGCSPIIPYRLIAENTVSVWYQQEQLDWLIEALPLGYRTISPAGELYYFQRRLQGTSQWLLTSIDSLSSPLSSVEYDVITFTIEGQQQSVALPVSIYDHIQDDIVIIDYETSNARDDLGKPLPKIASSELIKQQDQGAYWQ